ncbi:hypothetical protein H5410_002611 [Solanum commersonii]|uniref:Uncharacterized protein n=1 Tax=Solanum commersonii TaxID=4109 RepID=A0A9J6B2E9_SOLCO|nr:hypothetical protein H5410_002611 [Solanum commersonii]
MKAEEDLQEFYQLEEEYWKQKFGMRWFTDGRKRKLQLNEIIDDPGVLFKESNDIGEAAVEVFEQQFKEITFNYDYTMIDCIPKLITTEQQENMNRTPMEKEVRGAVFSLNSDSPCGPYGYSGIFFNVVGKLSRRIF